MRRCGGRTDHLGGWHENRVALCTNYRLLKWRLYCKLDTLLSVSTHMEETITFDEEYTSREIMATIHILLILYG